MPRIAGVNIPENKQIEIALTHIYGIGLSLARKILIQAGIEFQKKAKDLAPEEINRLKEIIEKNLENVEIVFVNLIDDVLGAILGPDTLALGWAPV